MRGFYRNILCAIGEGDLREISATLWSEIEIIWCIYQAQLGSTEASVRLPVCSLHITEDNVTRDEDESRSLCATAIAPGEKSW